MGNGLSIWHWLIVILYIFLVVYPVARILGRLGYSKSFSIVALIPGINLIGLWVLAFMRWPNEGPTAGAR
jgi:hypothetical protein